MMKATYKRKHLTGRLFTVPEGESLTIWQGARQQSGRPGAGALAESLRSDQQAESREGMTQCGMAFEISKPTPQ